MFNQMTDRLISARLSKSALITAFFILMLMSVPLTAFAIDTDADGVDDSIDICPVIPNPLQRDDDGDTVGNLCDNCLSLANADQRDTNGDGYGNRCDADLNNDGAVNISDLGIMTSVFFTADPDADLDGDGMVDFTDLGLMESQFFQAPGPLATAQLTVVPDTVDLGDVFVGSSATAELTFGNRGNAPLEVTAITTRGPFTVLAPTAFTLPNEGLDRTVSIGFNPTSTGTFTQSLEITSNTENPVTVTITGHGVMVPVLSIDTNDLTFVAETVGAVSPPQTITISNTGNATLKLRGISISGDDADMFAQSSACKSLILPGQSCAVMVTFSPTSIGNKTAALAIQSDAGTTQSIALTGWAIPPHSNTILQLKAHLSNQAGIQPFERISTVLTNNITDLSTSISVTSSTGFPSDVSFIAMLNDGTNVEYVLVMAGMGTQTWTVVRGYNGSIKSAFSSATTVTFLPLVRQKGDVMNGPPMTSNVSVFPPSYTGTDHATIALQRIDKTAPIYFSASEQLNRRGAVATVDIGATDTSFTVDATDNETTGFPQTGNFQVTLSKDSTHIEDVLVTVGGPTTLMVVGGISGRAQNGTAAVSFSVENSIKQIVESDFLGNGGTGAYWTRVALQSGNKYIGMQPTAGALMQYSKQHSTMSFKFDGSVFEFLCNGNASFFVIADGVIQHAPNEFKENTYAGNYWHKFDFGSRKTRNIVIIFSATVAAVAFPETDTMSPWDRTSEVAISWDGDSYGQSEGYSYSSRPNSGGLGFIFEMMLNLGITNVNMIGNIGGAGYLSEGAPSLPRFPHKKFNALNRIAATTGSATPTIFFASNGHNDSNLGEKTLVAANIRDYFIAVRKAWPDTVIVAAQYYHQGEGATSPAAFQPYPNLLAQEPAILAGLQAAGGPWVYINTSEDTWSNSSGANGPIKGHGLPLITGAGYGGAPGYAGVHATGVGNADMMIRNDGVHPSNEGARYLGEATAAAIIAGVLAL